MRLLNTFLRYVGFRRKPLAMKARTPRSSYRRFVPCLEVLEDRNLLAASQISTTAILPQLMTNVNGTLFFSAIQMKPANLGANSGQATALRRERLC